MIEKGQEITWEDLFEALHGLHPQGQVGWYRITEVKNGLRIFALRFCEPVTAPESELGFSYAFSPLDRDYHIEQGAMKSLYAFMPSEKPLRLRVGQALWFLETFQRLRPSLFAYRERPRYECPFCAFPLDGPHPPMRSRPDRTAPSPLRR